MAATPRIKKFKLTALPDAVDFRDQMFVPTLVEVPATRPLADYKARIKGGPRILDQGRRVRAPGSGWPRVRTTCFGRADGSRRPIRASPTT